MCRCQSLQDQDPPPAAPHNSIPAHLSLPSLSFPSYPPPGHKSKLSKSNAQKPLIPLCGLQGRKKKICLNSSSGFWRHTQLKWWGFLSKCLSKCAAYSKFGYSKSLRDRRPCSLGCWTKPVLCYKALPLWGQRPKSYSAPRPGTSARLLPRSHFCLLQIPSYFIGTSLKAFITLYFVSLLFIGNVKSQLSDHFFKS